MRGLVQGTLGGFVAAGVLLLFRDPVPVLHWRQGMERGLFEGRARLTGQVWYTNTGPDTVNVTFEFRRVE